MTEEEMTKRFLELVEEFLVATGDDFDAVERAANNALDKVYTETQYIAEN